MSFILDLFSKILIFIIFIVIIFKIMEKINKSLDQFLAPKASKPVANSAIEREECDLQTGECYIIRSKDGIVERINKKYITEDGRQLLQD
jgi:hypothetical protein